MPDPVRAVAHPVLIFGLFGMLAAEFIVVLFPLSLTFAAASARRFGEMLQR